MKTFEEAVIEELAKGETVPGNTETRWVVVTATQRVSVLPGTVSPLASSSMTASSNVFITLTYQLECRIKKPMSSGFSSSTPQGEYANAAEAVEMARAYLSPR